MTDTNLALMNKLDILPQSGTLESMYADEEGDMLKSVNANIDDTQKRMDQHFDQMIKIYNHLHQRDEKRPKELISLLKQGKQTYDEYDEFQEEWSNYYDYAGRLRKQKADHVNILGGDNWENYSGKGEFDKDVQAHLNAQPELTAIQTQANDLAGQLNEQGYIYEANELINGPGGSYTLENELFQDIDSLLVHHDASYRPRAEAGMKILIPFGPDKGQYKTYDEAVGPEERRYTSDMIDSWYAYQHKDLAGGRLGLWKKDFINKLIERDDVRIKKELEVDGQALAQIQTENRAKDLETKIKQNPGYLIQYIDKYKGASGGRYDLARIEAFDSLIRGVKAGVLEREHIEAVLDHKFIAHDGHETTARKYWKKDSAKLMKAMRDSDNAEYQAITAEKEAAMKSNAVDILNTIDENDAPLTYKAVSDIQTQFAERHGLRSLDQLPDELKNLPYEGSVDDIALDQSLSWRHYTLGQQISMSDIRYFTSPELHKKWREIAKSGAGLSKDQEQKRNRAVTALVTSRTMESDVQKEKTPKWVSNYEQALEEYNTVYQGIKDNGGSDSDAHKEALKAVKTGLWTEVSPGVYQWDTRAESEFDPQPARAINAVIRSINKDSSVINIKEPWQGEEPHLKEAADYFTKSRAGRQINQPEFYKRIAQRIGIPTERLIRSRLVANDILKEGEIKLPEEENLSAEQQKLLFKPTGSKTHRVFLEADDTKWMLETLSSPIAEANGGYLSIRNKNGSYKNIEEVLGIPLAEVTTGDIADLIGQGYTNIGLYDLTPQGFINLVVSGGISPDTPFNEETQDLMILARMRQKSVKSNEYTTLQSQYRRLVNIPQEDREAFYAEVGELPPWLDLPNLQPAVAKELVNMLLVAGQQN